MGPFLTVSPPPGWGSKWSRRLCFSKLNSFFGIKLKCELIMAESHVALFRVWGDETHRVEAIIRVGLSVPINAKNLHY